MMLTSAFDDAAAQRSDPLRSTALLMHTMAAGDRAWTMDRLTPEQRESIAPLLAELDALEFSTDGFDFDSPPALPPKPTVHASLTADEQLIAALDAMPLSRMRAVLHGEPVALVRRLAAMHRWSWRAALVVDGETGTHETLVTPAATKPALCAVDRAVLDALRERVQAPCHLAEAKDDRSPHWRSTAAALGHRIGLMARAFVRDASSNPS